MKKFLCMTMLMLAALTVSAGGSDGRHDQPAKRGAGGIKKLMAADVSQVVICETSTLALRA